MNKVSIRLFTVVLFLSVTMLSCTDSATDNNSGPAVIEGRVENVSSQQNESAGIQSAQVQDVEGATVTAAQVTAEGNLETIGNAEAETDSLGVFTLEIAGEAMANIASDSRIIVVAESDEGTGKVFVTSDVQSGSTVQAKPVTVEATAEAGVLQELVANNVNQTLVTNADIEVAVDSAVAADAEANSAAVSGLATILAGQANVRTEFYAQEGIEVNGEEIARLETNAQVDLENSLYDLEETGGEQGNVYTAFLEAYANAALEAGVGASEAAKASELAAYVLLNSGGELSANTVAQVYRNNSFKTAVLLDAAVRNLLETTGAEESTVAIAEDAGSTLQTEIRTGTTASVDSIDAVFTDYREKIITAIEGDASIDGETFATVNDIVGGEGGAEAAFEVALSGTTDPGLIVDAYSTFYSAVRSTVSSSFGEADSETVDAYTNLLILLNIAS